MTRSLRIAVADDEPDMRDYFQRILPRLGHKVVTVAKDGRELVDQCRKTLPDIVITDIRMPELDGIDAAIELCRERPTPCILVSAYHETELIERAVTDHVMGYLVKPIKSVDLEPMIALTIQRFEEIQALRRKNEEKT